MKYSIIVISLLITVFATPSHSIPVMLFDGSFTGSELNDLVGSGDASYPGVTPTLTGDRLDFGIGVKSEVLYRMAIVEAGEMDILQNLDFSIVADWDMLSSDNDLTLAISDGNQLLGINVGNQNMVWAVDGSDNGVSYTSTFTPSQVIAHTQPFTLDIEVGSVSSYINVSNGVGDSFGFNLNFAFDLSNQIDFMLGRDSSGERYGINSLAITATAETVAVPAPSSMLLFLAGALAMFRLRKSAV